MPPTPRLALPVPAEADTPDVPRDLSALATKLDEATAGGVSQGAAWYMQGTFAARPAAGTRGRLYWGTDTVVMYWDDGAAWRILNPATAQQLLDAPGSTVMQQGVVNPGEGIVTRLSNVAVRVAAGNAWIDADGVVGPGRYPCSWVQTDLTGIPAAAAGVSRVDRIIVRLQGQYGIAPTVERLVGGEAAGQTLNNRNLAAAIPNGCLHLADVQVDNTGVIATTGIRSRRTFCQGWRQTITRHANAGGTSDYASTATSWVIIDSASFQGWAEVRNPVEVAVEGMFQGMNPLLMNLNMGAYATQEVHFTDLPADGSGYASFKRIAVRSDLQGASEGIAAGEESVRLAWNLSWASGVGGQTMRLLARANTPAMIELIERPVGPPVANTADH